MKSERNDFFCSVIPLCLEVASYMAIAVFLVGLTMGFVSGDYSGLPEQPVLIRSGIVVAIALSLSFVLRMFWNGTPDA